MRNTILSVDTGLNALGWALWLDADAQTPKPPDSVGVIDYSKKRDWLRRPWTERAAEMLDTFANGPLCRALEVRRDGTFKKTRIVQVLEMPEFRAGSAVGHAAASTESLGMLYFMCGGHQQVADMLDVETRFARVSEWKGTLPKRVVEKRLRRAIGIEARDGMPIESHAWDAVGIGLWAAGHRIDDGKKFGGAQ